MLVRLLIKYYVKFFHYIAALDDTDDYMIKAKCSDPKNPETSVHYHYLYKPDKKTRAALKHRNMSRLKGRCMPITAAQHTTREKRIKIKSVAHLLNTIHYIRCPKSQGQCRHSEFKVHDNYAGIFPLCEGHGHNREDCHEYKQQLFEIFGLEYNPKAAMKLSKTIAARAYANKRRTKK